MFLIENNIIYLTKGDDAVLTVDIKDDQGDVYNMEESDVLTLTVRKKPCNDDPTILQISSETNTLVFHHNDTSEILPGKYSADIQLTTAAGLRFTVFPLLPTSSRSRMNSFDNFVIMPEVTME